MTFRSLIFWPHLVAGVVAGAVILVMSATGVLLTYEKQMIAWADRNAVTSASAGERLPVEQLVSRVNSQIGVAPASLTVPADQQRPVLASVAQRTVLVDPRSGAVLGDSAPRMRQFFREVTSWHRYLALSGERRVAGKAITGWSNFIFLFIVLSGMYLWIPRRWSWQHVRAVIWFKRTTTAKARDFNWHHVLGIWSAVPLAVVVASAMPISFPWANALVYRAVGETPPAPAARPAAAPRPGGETREAAEQPAPVKVAGLDAAFQRAQQQAGDWRSMTVRVPTSDAAPFIFTIDRGTAGQPQYRGTFTVARDGAARWEPFSGQSLGRRVRSISRFLHTGEVLGLAGQTVAGVVSLASVVLVWTGIALALRRFRSRRSRRAVAVVEEQQAA